MSALSRIEKKIHKAVEDGDLENLRILEKWAKTRRYYRGQKIDFSRNQKFLKHLVNSKGQDNVQKTLLHKAALQHSLEIVEFLIQLGANVNAKAENDCTPLHYAAYKGKIEVVKYLIEHGAQVDMRKKGGATPLHWAAENSKIEVVKYLIDYGAQVNLRNKFGFTPLHWAAYKGKIEAVKCLIEHGAQMDVRDKDNMTPFQVANKRDIMK